MTRKPNQEAKIYGLRYLSSYANELSWYSDVDPDMVEQTMFVGMLASLCGIKRSQLGQDVFAFSASQFAREGYFVEVGAHHAEHLSNTWMLEKKVGWTGLLFEPNVHSISGIKAARNATLVDKAAWNVSGERLTFRAVADSALSTISTVEQRDQHDRSNFSEFEVETITLNDALEHANAPRHINYLSIDVEGAELHVLDGLDFDRWDFRAITIEHNNDTVRVAEYDRRLSNAGYTRVLNIVSDFDAWYINTEHLAPWRQCLECPGMKVIGT